MSQDRSATEGARTHRKRLLAAGRKLNGTWEVRTFLRPAGGPRQTFWEARGATRSTTARAR